VLTYFRYIFTKPAEARKAIVGLVSFLATAATLALAQGDVIPTANARWVVFGSALLNAYLTFRVPNDRAPGTSRDEADDLSVRG
jgi:hypothetical protein